jgi:hypothetical protein
VATGHDDYEGGRVVIHEGAGPEVREVERDHRGSPDAAQPELIAEPVDLAQPWADAAAIGERRKRPLRALVQFARAVEREVGRLEGAHARSLAPGEDEVTR